jgi:hypothetical protein
LSSISAFQQWWVITSPFTIDFWRASDCPLKYREAASVQGNLSVPLDHFHVRAGCCGALELNY